MTVFDWDDLRKKPIKQDIILTIGVFDGLHRGHQQLIERVVGNGGGASAVLSFSSSPKSVLLGTADRQILSQRQKEHNLRQLGIENLIVIDFSKQFSQIRGETFVSQVLDRVAVRGVVVGKDFRCGRNRDTDSDTLRSLLGRYGIDTDIVELVRCEKADACLGMVSQEVSSGEKVSSSGIRQAIQDGDFTSVRSRLGRDYELDVADVKPCRTGDSLVFSASELTQLLPRSGQYSGSIVGSGTKFETQITVENRQIKVSSSQSSSFDNDSIGICFERNDT